MRISRWYVLLAVAIVASLVIVPSVAFAAGGLLTNEWGQSFLGSGATTAIPGDGCIACHTDAYYNRTTHGQFAPYGDAVEPGPSSGMWPIGLDGKGETVEGVDFSLGGGTGLREYLVFGNFNQSNGIIFDVPSLEWDPSQPSLWEIDGVAGIEWEDYGCNQCHMLGATKVGITPPVAGASAGTKNSWATFAGADLNDPASYIPGSGIQCERCHGTGIETWGADSHWGQGVAIVGFGANPNAKAKSTNILKSEVCGQCHGSFKSGNIAGYTPDRNINAFVKSFTLADVPGTKFWPNGENKTMKHVYYTEWALSGHSVRGFYSANATDSDGLALTTPYQQSGASHYTSAGSSRLLCNRCHTGEGYLKRKGASIMNDWVEGTDPAGKIGQECAVCHISHGNVGATDTADAVAKNEAVGMAVREPEKANGVYSTLNLNIDNKSICEDCHNWQREVANGGSAPELSTISWDAVNNVAVIGVYVRHPQRETYHGRVMKEVPAASDFMPGAKCEQCHMPATKSDFPTKTQLPRYADRSWKRYSHRMFIMMPGDAEAWGLAPWGDSCSPCHAGETQSGLQANIDSWQNTAADLAASVQDMVTARYGALSSNGSVVVPAAELTLLRLAGTNVSAFTEDGSGGAHNPPYEQAGLAKALVLAKSAGGTITAAAPAKASSGSLFGIAGIVTNGDGSRAAGATVKLYDGATLLGTTVADANGNYGFAWAQTSAKTYTVKWIRSSDSSTDKTASVAVAMDVAKVATDLELVTNRSSVDRGVSYRLTASISPAFAGAPIVFEFRLPGESSYRAAATVNTAADGTATFTRTTSRSTTTGTWTWRARFAGNTSYLSSSATTRVTIH